MSDYREISLSGEITFQPESYDQVVAAIGTFVVDARNDSGILGYDYYVNEEKSAIVVREHYTDDESMLTHIKAMNQDAVNSLFSVAKLGTVTVTGLKSPEVAEALGGFEDVRWYAPLAKI